MEAIPSCLDGHLGSELSLLPGFRDPLQQIGKLSVLLTLLFLIFLYLRLNKINIENKTWINEISDDSRRTIGEWKRCYRRRAWYSGKALFQYLEPMTQECRWMSLMHRIETYPLPRQDGDIQYHIYKNGTARNGRTVLLIENGIDKKTVKRLSSGQGSHVLIGSTITDPGNCTVITPKECQKEMKPSTLTIKTRNEVISGEVEAVFDQLNLTIVDYLMVHEIPYEIMPLTRRNGFFDSLNTTICQISVIFPVMGLYNSDIVEEKFYTIWSGLVREERFAPVQVTTSGKRTVLLLNIEHPYCIANYLEPFMKMEGE